MQLAIRVFIASAVPALATGPCERLCVLDGPQICTGGSYAKGGGICHAYFLLPSGVHCYHNAATRQVCHDRLPPLTIDQAAFFVDALTPDSTTTSSTLPPSTRRTSTTTTTTTTVTTTPHTTTSTTSTTTPRTITSTTSTTTPRTTPRTTSTSTSTTTTTTSSPATSARRRIVQVGSTSTTTAPPQTERRRRVFPISGPGEQGRPVSIAGSLVDPPTVAAPTAPVVAASITDLVVGEGLNVIGRSVEAAVARISNWPTVVELIARTFSQPSMVGVSGEDFMFLWERSRGALVLEEARRVGYEGCRAAHRLQNACFALVVFIGEMPLPADAQSRADALELIGFTQFATDNARALTELLRSSLADHSLGSFGIASGMNARSQGVLVGFAANWLGRFPMLSPDAPSRSGLLSATVRHRIYRYALLMDQSRYGLDLNINRGHAFAESYETIARARPETVRNGVYRARFAGEAAVGPGTIREWFSQVSQDVWASDYGLFERREEAPHFYRISQMAGHHPRECFIAIGRFMAMSIIQGIPVGISMNRMFYKRLLGHAIGLADVEDVDEEVFRSLQTVMGYTSAEEMAAIDAPLPYVYPDEHADAISATLENRDTQLAIALDNLSHNSMPDQFAWFTEGFFAITPREMFDGLTANDVSSILFGDANIDIDDLEAHLRFNGFTRESRPVGYLMQVLREMDQHDRRRFLKFVTSNTQLPLGGFASLYPPMMISRDERDGTRLPDSHTCFNTLDLPDYTSLEQTREKIIYAITHGNGRMDNY